MKTEFSITTRFVPKINYQEYPAEDEQRRYMFQAAIAALFVTACVLVSFAVS